MTDDILVDITPVNFESVRTPAVDVYLRFQDDIADRWDTNQKNTLRFEELKSALTKGPVTCYFQRDKPFVTKKGNTKQQHSIFIQINEECAIKIQVSVWREEQGYTYLYLYNVNKCFEIPFVKAPDKDVFITECSLHIITRSQQGGTSSNDFIRLCKTVDELNIPATIVNREKDVAIWNNYVSALDKLVKAKERVWKVRDFRGPYTKRNVNDENNCFIDIHVVGEKEELENQLRAFLDDKSEIYELKREDNESITIEYPRYKTLYQSDEESLNELAQEYCYGFDSQPLYSSTGELTISHANSENIRVLYDDFIIFLKI